MSLPTLTANEPYPAVAWPGGYPLVYVTADNGQLCPACANRENGSEADASHGDLQWRLIASDVHWEGPPLRCDHCGAGIDSAYGDPANE